VCHRRDEQAEQHRGHKKSAMRPGDVEESLDIRGRVILWIDDIQNPPRRVILAANCDASRYRLRAHDDDAGHSVCLEKFAQLLFHDRALAARRVTHEYFFAIAHDDSRMKYVEILARRRKKNQITCLQMSFEPRHCRLRYTFDASSLWIESGYDIQNAIPAYRRQSRH